MLSIQQDHFCQLYVETSNATISYLTAFTGITYNTARSMGSALMKNEEVKSRIEELAAIHFAQYNKNKMQMMQMLLEDARKCEEMGLMSEKRKYLDMVIKMQGHYEAQKIEMQGNVQYSFVIPGADQIEARILPTNGSLLDEIVPRILPEEEEDIPSE